MLSRGWMVEWWIFHILYQFPGDVSSWGVLGPAGPTHLILCVSLLVSAWFFRMYSPIDSVDFPIEFRIFWFKSLFICPVHVPSFAYRCPQLCRHLCPYLTQNYDLDGTQCLTKQMQEGFVGHGAGQNWGVPCGITTAFERLGLSSGGGFINPKKLHA